MHKLINQLLGGLPDRERAVLIGRYGLEGDSEHTLAEIGKRYGITRERVRQIEAFALNEARTKLTAAEAKAFVRDALALLARNGGVMRDADVVVALARERGERGSAAAFAPAARFMLELSGKASLRREDATMHAFWYASPADAARAKHFVEELCRAVRAERPAILAGAHSLDACVSRAIKAAHVSDAAGRSYLATSKQFAVSPFGDSGLAEWPEIQPKAARDWAYLITKKEGKPLHFTELVAKINRLRTKKLANVQTVHNELIKDDRFVLAGRGTYGLREFGILPGTAREVISHFLKANGPLPAREIVRLVLGERMFKEGTLLINLQNRNYFKRLGDGRYTLV